ncbi:hypothetical protein [Paenibacillus dendritiformis]|uniref:hypothetical protein n=1 Tax=Paenibacillus dendritiformis TaxID=130049 RepID=UPI000DA7F7F0|nr:hypothetical protein [Paenibacillus dendritiformis]PZM62600.1 hypothetical protein DOE73_26445 [Paenibacillus dendritiformis]
MEIKRCTGCGEVAEVQGEDELCFYCQKHEDLMHKFTELENEEIRIADEIMELESEAETARENWIRAKEKVTLARKRLRENDRKMRDFNWSVEQP